MRYRKSILTLLLSILISIQMYSQEYGCTDPQAVNYNADATINDGSCIYEPTSYNPDIFLNLPAGVNESSGLIFFDGSLWTHNDSDGETAIYRIDISTGNIVQIINIRDAVNTDWEDMCQDEDYIYIGDFGNNNGNRKDLHVLIIAKDDIPIVGDVTVDAEKINFYYEDQTSFVPAQNNNNFDCEAMICVVDSIYLFTKNWINKKTKLYRIPKLPGNFSAILKDSLQVNGLITGAAFNPIRREIVLTGYKNYTPFAWLLFDYQDKRFFSGNKRRIDFPEIFGAQTEGVCYLNELNVLVSSEKTKLIPQRIYKVETGLWIVPPSMFAENKNEAPLEIRFNPSLADNQVHFEVIMDDEIDLNIEIYDYLGRLFEVGFYVYTRVENVYHISMDIGNLPRGFYVLKVAANNRYGIGKLIKN